MSWGGGFSSLTLGASQAHAVDVGANPTPKVDIAVSLPSDYPGTFLEFKQELTQKLIDQGMAPGSFRITDTAAKIDTSNTEGWLVYNHNTGSVNIANYFDANQGKLTNTSCLGFSSHIYNFTQDGKTSMVFAGYPDIAAFDGMIYPAPSNARRTFSFDVNGSAVKTHTLNSTGFMMNVGRNANGTLSGYYLRLTGSNDKISNAAIYKVDNFNPTNNSVIGGTQVGGATQATNLGDVNRARFTVELRETSVTVQKQNYDASGNLGEIDTLFNGPVALVANGYNGFGPYMQNSSHGCQVFTQFSFLDLEMKYDSSAFDALKTTQYYEGAQQKYFINLAGDSNDPQIPDETDETFADGINRMNENEIFYLSNAQDGKIVRDTTTDADGTVHQGLGAQNGFIAMSDDYVTEMAEYIYQSFIEGKSFDQAAISSDIPLANFYMINAATGDQLMTVHQRHLFNNDATVEVNFHDKSIIGQLAGPDGKIAQWCFRVLDPDNNEVYTSGWVDDPSKVADYQFNKNSKNGKWIFELTVKDQNGYESKPSQTYITAFLDDKVPLIEGSNSSKNTATFTFTDTGQGIDDDGITFIEDNRGSGVAAYWITNDESVMPTEDDWEYFDEVAHSASVDYPLDDTKPIVVWVKDECGNLGAKTVFQPTHVQVQDPDGKPIDDYIVIGEKPIIVLPDEGDLDDPDDPEDKFSGWTTDKGDPVTPGTDVPPSDDHTIVIRPNYTKDYANLIYLAAGGQIAEDSTAAYTSFQVISGNSILQKIQDQNVLPVREGYSFKGWKLVVGDTNTIVDGLVNKEAGTTTASGNQLIDPDDQVAKLIKIDESDTTVPVKPANIKKNNYYLVAQWEIGDYTVRLDANGGSLGSTRSFEGIKYQTNVGSLKLPVSGRSIPTKPGCIFQGWSTTKNVLGNTDNTFAVATGVTGITPIAAPTMPAHDLTLYAVWKEDTDQFVVHFDSDGGSRVSDQAYKTATATNYTAFKTPTRPGYDFDGWYMVMGDSLSADAYTGNEAITNKSEHTFRAKWIPRDDTKYTVDYYVNSGNKDANGNYIYTKVNDAGVTKTSTGATESTVAVKDSEKLPEITTAGETYWYNENSSRVVETDGQQTTINNNVLTGVITGNPLLSLKLYYDRYFDAKVVKDVTSTGDGTCTSALKQKEGTTPMVSWAAAAGSHVKYVIVDGVVRDDLVSKTSYTVENPLDQDVIVRVVFEKDSADDPGTAKPKPPVTEDTYFTIKTKIEGSYQADAVDLTPTHSIKNGGSTQVEWSVAENSRYTITSVKVDGAEYDVDKGSVDFDNILGDHEVVVTVDALPTIGGTDVVTADKYTVTVNRYGGDDKVITSPTVTVNDKDSVRPSWDATNSDYKIVKIVVDGTDITGTLNERQLQQFTGYKKAPFNTGISANHVVDIYLAKPDPTEPDAEPVVPDYTDKEQFVTINTKLVGAEGDISGSITGGAVVEKGSGGYDVSWALQASDSDMKLGQLEQGSDGLFYATQKDGADVDPGDDSYVCYELEKVVVNGKEIEKDANGKLTVPTDADQEVEVHVRPVLHTVTIVKYGEGTVSSSKSVYHLGDYKNLKADPDEGSVLAKVVIDGETVWQLPEEQIADAPAVAAMSLLNSVEVVKESVESSKAVATEAKDSSESNSSKDSGSSDNTASTDESKQKDASADEAVDGADSSTSAEDDAEADAEETLEQPDASGATETTEASEEESASQTAAVLSSEGPSARAVSATIEDDATPQVDLFGMLLRTLFMPLTAEAVEPDGFDRSDMDQEGIVKDHKIEVYFAKQATNEDGTPKETPDGKPVVNPLPPVLHSVTATIAGGEGAISGNAIVEDGGNATITITPKDGYKIEKVVDAAGNEVMHEDGKIELSNVSADHNYTVTLKREPVKNNNDPVPGDFNVDPTTVHAVTTSVQGGAGTISGAGSVADGSSRTVTWAPSNPEEKVAYVFVDGEPRPDLVDANSVTFNDITSNHHVAVVFDTNPTNIDKDGDGDPDINKDTDGDGIPDTDVDTDGDGEPDVNKDTDGDGKPDVDIVDTDGDGKPDPVDPKDPDSPKTPTTNVDTDGDGKPDVNKDTDGDGKPDVNIVDTDGDGKPDPVDPKDPDSPKTPTTNVDTDGDGKPDVNIDNDDDGIPDTNIVDVDLDGKPDPVDPKADPAPKPNVNIDTDGDGKPDLNVDTDGDGKPDLNIVDKDKDGVPDPVDPKADPAPKPDVNVDTDGDGKPDINIDTDGDGIPDKNIDTDDNGSYGPEDEGHPDHAQWLKDQEKKDDDKAGAGDKSSSDDKGGKSDSDKTRLSQTGDQLMPLMATMALLAMASLVVAMGAGRRTRRAKAGKHAR